MANKSENILDKARAAGLARPDGGMRVPDGYFESFAGRMSAILPDRPELESEVEPQRPRTFWAAVRPYIYMAAMFAGVWCMLQMFHTLSGKADLAPMDSNPVLAQGLLADDFLYDYVAADVSALNIYDDMMDEGFMPDDIDMAVFSDDFTAETETDQILPQ